MRDPHRALGIATHFLAHRVPFARFRAGELLATLDGEICRKHYLFAFEGPRVVGYLGWALFDEPTAERLAATMHPPSNELAARFATSGDVGWVLTAAAITPTTMHALAAAARQRHPVKYVYGVRHGPDGRVSIRRVGARSRIDPSAIDAAVRPGADTEFDQAFAEQGFGTPLSGQHLR